MIGVVCIIYVHLEVEIGVSLPFKFTGGSLPFKVLLVSVNRSQSLEIVHKIEQNNFLRAGNLLCISDHEVFLKAGNQHLESCFFVGLRCFTCVKKRDALHTSGKYGFCYHKKEIHYHNTAYSSLLGFNVICLYCSVWLLF